MIYGLALQVAKARTWVHVVGYNLYMLRVTLQGSLATFHCQLSLEAEYCCRAAAKQSLSEKQKRTYTFIDLQAIVTSSQFNSVSLSLAGGMGITRNINAS